MEIVIILAMIIGIINGLDTISKTRSGQLPSTPSSTSLIEFIFLNR